jgi:hypothetical protein
MKLLKNILFLSATIALVAGCSSTPPEKKAPVTAYRYDASAPMSSQRVTTADSKITFLLPKGWKLAADDPSASELRLWLVSNDYDASLTVMPIQMDPALYKVLQRDGLGSVAKVSMSLKEGNVATPVTIVREPERFNLEGRAFFAYEYTVNNKLTIVRVVVFDTGTEFLECACVPAAEQLSPAKQRELFETQQSVLASMVLN